MASPSTSVVLLMEVSTSHLAQEITLVFIWAWQGKGLNMNDEDNYLAQFM